MCIGTPMRLVADGEFAALAEGDGETRQLSLLLVGALPAGSWVLAQGGLAMRTLNEDEAAAITAALAACRDVLAGGDGAAGFADLIEREPQLPDWLRGGENVEPDRQDHCC